MGFQQTKHQNIAKLQQIMATLGNSNVKLQSIEIKDTPILVDETEQSQYVACFL